MRKASLLPVLMAILAAGLLAVRAAEVPGFGVVPPRIDSIRVDGKSGDVVLCIVSGEAWKLQWSGNLVGWVEIYRSAPEPGAVQIFWGRDRAWGKVAPSGFYRVVPRAHRTISVQGQQSTNRRME